MADKTYARYQLNLPPDLMANARMLMAAYKLPSFAKLVNMLLEDAIESWTVPGMEPIRKDEMEATDEISVDGGRRDGEGNQILR